MTYGGFKRMTSFCKTAIPADISSSLESIKDNDEAVKVQDPGHSKAFSIIMMPANVASCRE